MRIWLAVPPLLMLMLGGCASEEPATQHGSTSTLPRTSSVAAPAVVTPPYELIENGARFQVLVRTDDTGQLRAAFNEIAERVLASYPDDGYFVQIDCAIDHDPGKAANRLGNGKIAVGNIGAARTGLKPGQKTLEFNTGRTCRDGAPTTTFNPDRQLDRDYALELCQGRIEEKYVADQRPVTLTDVTVTEGADRWIVTGKAQGKAKAVGSMAVMDFACEIQDNPLRTAVTKFAPL